MAHLESKSPDTSFTLFVVLPTEEVCTLRRIPSGIYVNEVKGKLELAAGLPSNIYMLTYPDGECLSDRERLLIQENVRDGYLLRAQIMDNWDTLYNAVVQNNTEYVYHSGGVHVKGNIMVGQDDTGKIENMVRERATAALFIAAYSGLVKMCNLLISIGVNMNGSTHFGRTALHAAVCKDRIQIVNMLLDAGASVHVYDRYSQSPVDVAKSYNSFQCEKRLRLMQLNLRGLKDLQGKNSYSNLHRKGRISSTPQIAHYDSEAARSTKPKSTSAGTNRQYSESASSHNKNEQPKKLLSARSDKNNNAIKTRTDGYWVISQTNPRQKELDGALEKRYLNFLEHHDKLIQNKQYPLSASKYRILKFKKDSADMAVGNPSLPEESKLTPGRIIAPVPVDTVEIHVQTEHQKESNKINSPKNTEEPSLSNSTRESDKHTCDSDNNIRKSSLKSGTSQLPKRVRFSAKLRSLKNLAKPETMESFKDLKRKISIAANRTDSARSTSSRNSGITHESWLQRKQAEERKLRSDSSDSSDSEDNAGDSDAFKEWIKKKKEANYGPPRTITRPIPGLIQIGSTDVGDGRNPDPIHNIKAYKNWIGKRQKTKRIPNVERLRTMQDFMAHKKKLEEKRQQLLMIAITYEEWMDFNEEKKLLIQKILRADLEELKNMEKELSMKKAPHQISFEDWKEKAKKRREEELIRREKQKRFLEEEQRDKRVNGRSSAAIPHAEWLRLKRTSEPQPRHSVSPRPDSMCGSAQTRKEAEETYQKWSSARLEDGANTPLPYEKQLRIGSKSLSPLVSVR
ncbi:microtubule-associated protein 9-like [Saccostrea echinata]|uniref:microtubule-associated protein 9-like n=1 Tax=Saccostrea echinata TaxID=191078 RepID=UPI002A83DC9E|nr:microtubule-associated protein 9-like [Saccostrea echinata]